MNPYSHQPADPPEQPPKQAYPQRPRFYIRLSPPIVTRVLLAINVVVFVAMIIYGYVEYGTINGTEDTRVLADFGAKINLAIAQGETWRLFTAMFLHIGVIHLLFNLYALNALGPMVEGYFGHIRFTAIYVLAGLTGSLASYAFSPVASAGASGAVFGLAGAIIVYFLRYRENFGARGRAILQNMLLIIGINLVFGLSTRGIDNWGHIGGLIGGAVVAYGLLPHYKRPELIVPDSQALEEEQRTLVHLIWVVLFVGLLALGLSLATQSVLSTAR